jgi:drug/metabolite transporter superfamily protein YnfA
MLKRLFNRSNFHLIISTSIVFPISFVYALNPNLLFDIPITTIDQANVFKAIMGIYLGFSLLWIYGIVNPSLWKTATLTNMIFMFGLCFGRIISLLSDGIPSTLFILGTFGELILGCYCVYILKRDKKQS